MKLNKINEKIDIRSITGDNTNIAVGGLADGKDLNDVFEHHTDPEWDDFKKLEFRKLLERELEEGIKVEFEHTNDRKLSKEIALDHLWEDPMYYTKLATIEEGYPGSGTGGLRTSPKKVTVDSSDVTNKNEVPDDLEDSNNQLPIPKEPNDRLKPIDKFGPGDR